MSMRTMLSNAFVKERYPCCKLLFAPQTGAELVDLVQGATLARVDGADITLNPDGAMVLGSDPILNADFSDIDGSKDIVLLMVSMVSNNSGLSVILGDNTTIGNTISMGQGAFTATIDGGVETINNNDISMVEIVAGNVYQYTDATNNPFGAVVASEFISVEGFTNDGNNVVIEPVNAASATEITVTSFTTGVAESAGNVITIKHADQQTFASFGGGLGLTGMALAIDVSATVSQYSLTSADVFATDGSGTATPLMRQFDLKSKLALVDGNFSFLCVLQFADGLPADLEVGIETMLNAARNNKVFTVYPAWERLRG